MAMIQLTDSFQGKTKPQIREDLIGFYDDVWKSDHKYTGSDIQWEIALEHFPNFKKALDVGCGDGEMIERLRKTDRDVWGVDIAESLKDIWKKKGIEKYCKIAPARKMPFEDNSFDLVVCFNTLEHIPEWDIDESIKEIARVGNDKFFFVITTSEEMISTNGYDSHICVKFFHWWIQKIQQHIEVIQGFPYKDANIHINFSFCDIFGEARQ